MSVEAGPDRSLVVIKRVGRTLIVRLNNPAKRNALSPRMLAALADAWEDADDDDIRGVVLTGTGASFCAGADLKADPAELAVSVRDRQRYFYNPMTLKLTLSGKPLVVAVNGAAVGAGLGLACCGDVRIASSNATFHPGFARIGRVPDMGASHHVRRILGYERALQWILGGQPMSAEEAREARLVRLVVEPDELVPTAISHCEALASSASAAVGLTKLLLRQVQSPSLAAQIENEVQYQAIVRTDPASAAAKSKLVDSLGSAGAGRADDSDGTGT